MADKLKNIEECLSLAKSLKSNVTKVFQELASKTSTKRDAGDAAETSNAKGAHIAQTLKKNLINVNKNLSDLDKANTGIPASDSNSVSLGNTGLLSLDPVEDKTPLYEKVVETYDWNEKLISECKEALTCLKRLHPPGPWGSQGRPQSKKAKTNLRGELQKALEEIKTFYPTLELSNTILCGTFALEVVVPRTLRATVVMRLLEIDQVFVRGLKESSLMAKKDPWSQSRHAVFRKITDFANAASLHYYSAHDPTAQLLGIMKWLNSLQRLFSSKCVGCNRHLKEEAENVVLPPCWRTYEDLSPYHYVCRP